MSQYQIKYFSYDDAVAALRDLALEAAQDDKVPSVDQLQPKGSGIH